MSIGLIILIGLIAVLVTSIAFKWMDNRKDTIIKCQETEIKLKELDIERIKVKHQKPRSLVEVIAGIEDDSDEDEEDDEECSEPAEDGGDDGKQEREQDGEQ